MFTIEPEEKQGAEHRSGRFVYSETPFLVYWEVTRACDLACRHCRAEAIKVRDVLELNTAEGETLLEQMRDFGPRKPHLVITGGDPLKRGDVFDLIEQAFWLGIPVSLAPTASTALTKDVMRLLKTIGIESIGLSLDGSTAERHDGVRGVPGCFAQTVKAIHLALDEGLDIQVNTLAAAETLEDIPQIYKLLSGLDLMRWKLFTLVAVGRGKMLTPITAEQCEGLHHWLYELSKRTPFAVSMTEAPHYRRVVFTGMKAEGLAGGAIRQTSVGRGFGIRDGNGIMFISHTGEIYPSGFLPLSAGNVRTSHIVKAYRDSELFRKIRQTSSFKGRCGRCEFREICGGSRARAYASTGDPLESDPLCAYQPA